MEIIPVGEVMRQLIVALGAALVVGNVAVLVRERRRRPDDDRPRPNRLLIGLNIAIGLVLAVWGTASLLAA